MAHVVEQLVLRNGFQQSRYQASFRACLLITSRKPYQWYEDWQVLLSADNCRAGGKRFCRRPWEGTRELLTHIEAASIVAGAIDLMPSTIRLLRITSDPRAEIDITTLELESCRDSMSKIADTLSGRLEGRRTRTMAYYYNALSYTCGEDNHDQLALDAKTLLKNIYEVRATREESKRLSCSWLTV